LKGVQCLFILSLNNYSNDNYNETGSTDSNGLLTLTVNPALANLSQSQKLVVVYTCALPGSSSLSQYGPVDLPSNLTKGEVYGLGFVSAVIDASNASQYNVQVFYAGPGGTEPHNYSVYYEVYSSTSDPVSGITTGGSFEPQISQLENRSTTNASQIVFLGTLNGYHETYAARNLTVALGASEIVFAIYSSNGTLLQTSDPLPISAFISPYIQQTPAAIVNLDLIDTGSILFPLMAILASYNSYGNDRISGVIDYVLSQPVSRRQLAISRYLSVVLPLTVSVVWSILSIDLIIKVLTGRFLIYYLVLSAMGSFVVTVAAFAGAVFLLSHLVKSTSLLLSVSVALFALFSFFWNFIVEFLSDAAGFLFVYSCTWQQGKIDPHHPAKQAVLLNRLK
ncbi:MAG: ABC transporter permease, partial [Nitrososphaerales archaeon]